MRIGLDEIGLVAAANGFRGVPVASPYLQKVAARVSDI
jgi:hypothetical protein